MTSRDTILLILIVLANICSGQTTKVLQLKKERFFSEQNSFLLHTCATLVQEVCYNQPNTIDEEYCHILTITINELSKAKQLKAIDLNKDTSIVNCVYDRQSVWNWQSEQATISGFIKISSWTKKSIVVDLDITVFDRRYNWTYIYKGSRSFFKTNNITKKN